MARLNKRRQKQNDNANETDGSETPESTSNKQAKKTTGKKRKAKSEQGDSFSNKEVKKKSCYNLRSNYSGDVKFVSEELCCKSAEDRMKYEKLGLNTALFLSCAKPAKRKQSHISVITISSSDDDEIYYQRTADWVATMDVDSPGNLGEEDAAPVASTSTPGGVAAEPASAAVGTTSTPDSGPVAVGSEDDSFNHHLSKLRVTTPSGSNFKPLYVSTPQPKPSGGQQFDSFLTNPLPKIPKQSLTVSANNVLLSQEESGKFYFGNSPSKSQNDSGNTLENSSEEIFGSPNMTGIHEFSSDLSSAGPLSKEQEHCDSQYMKSDSQQMASDLQQMPSTSKNPPQIKSPRKKSSVRSNPNENV